MTELATDTTDPEFIQETWESTTGGTTFVHVHDPRNPRLWITKRVGGKQSKRIKITQAERIHNQELIPDENKHLDPFTNGLLIRVIPRDVERGEYEVTDAQLIELAETKSDDEFQAAATAIASEVVLRRLFAIAEDHATNRRYVWLRDLVLERYPRGRESRWAREQREADEKFGGATGMV